jgi:hypothetical protein
VIKFIKKTIQDISSGKNIEHYIALIFIVIILALDVFNLATPDILTEITLAVLALVVFTSLSTREGIDELSDKLIKPPNADEFFWKKKRTIESDLAQAKYIGFVGASLSRTLRDYSPILENRLNAGAKVRVMLMDPKSTAPDQAVLRSQGVNRQYFIDSLRPTIERIGLLSKSFDKVELGLLPYKPAFGMIVIDPDKPYGKIIIEMYPHHSPSFAPTFELQPNRDSHWYKHFREQFDNIWNACDQRRFTKDGMDDLINEVRTI